MAVSSVSVVVSSMSLRIYKKPAYFSPFSQNMNKKDEDSSLESKLQLSVNIYNPVSFERYVLQAFYSLAVAFIETLFPI